MKNQFSNKIILIIRVRSSESCHTGPLILIDNCIFSGDSTKFKKQWDLLTNVDEVPV